MISRSHFEAIEQSNASDDAELDILNEKFRFRWRLKNCQVLSLFDDKFLRLQTLLTGGNLSTYLIDMWLSTLFSNVELDGFVVGLKDFKDVSKTSFVMEKDDCHE